MSIGAHSSDTTFPDVKETDKTSLSKADKDVLEISNINFEGNIIPIEWFQHLKLDNGKTDMNSIILLSDIVYWYRPTTIRNETTGQPIGYKKKFRADLLQRGYKDFEALFNLSREQIKNALQRLEKFGLIKRVFRNLQVQGSTIANVMYIQIFPAKVREITDKMMVWVYILIPIGIFPQTSQFLDTHLKV